MVKNFFRRAVSFTAAIFVLFGSFCIFLFDITANAESEGYWKLVDSGDVIQKTNEEMTTDLAKVECTLSDGRFTYRYENTSGDSKQYGAPPDHPTCDGDYVTQSISVSKPNSTYKAGDTVTLSYSSEVSHSEHMPDMPTDFSAVISEYDAVKEPTGTRYPSTYYFSGDSFGYEIVPNGGYTYIDGKNEYNCNGYKGASSYLTAEMPKGKKTGENIWIKYNFFNGVTFYKYEWTEEKEPVEETVTEYSGYWQLVDKGDIIDGDKESWTYEYHTDDWSAHDGSFHYKLVHTNGDFKQYIKPPNHPNCDGEYVEMQLDVAQPKSIYKAGETMALSYSSSVSHTEHAPDRPPYLVVEFTTRDPKGEYQPSYSYHEYLTNADDESWVGHIIIEGGGFVQHDDGPYPCDGYGGTSETLTAIVPEGQKAGDKQWITESFHTGSTPIQVCWYEYEWVEGKTPEDSGSGSGENENNEETKNLEDKYYWGYVSTKEVQRPTTKAPQPGDRFYEYDDGDLKYTYKWYGENGNYTFTYNCKKNETNDYYTPYHDFGECAGEYIIYTLSTGDFLAAYKPGEEISNTMSIDASMSEHLCRRIDAQMWISISPINCDIDDPDGIYRTNVSLQDKYGYSDLVRSYSKLDDILADSSMTVSGKMPEITDDMKEGDYVYVIVTLDVDGITEYTCHKYVLTKGVSEGNAVIGGNGSKGDFFVDRNAWITPGEDGGGVSIPVKILIGLAGAGGTAASAAAAAGGAKGASSEEKRRRSSGYKMYIYKDFGDSLKKGVPAVGVFARIAEVTESGQEINHPELSAQIQLFSGTAGVTVRPTGMVNGYMGSEVCVPDKNTRANDGIVSARYVGQGGTFTQNVHFRLIGEKPYLQFPEKPKDALFLEKVMIPGDSSELVILMNTVDFADEPTSFTFLPISKGKDMSHIIKVRYERIARFRYKVILKSLAGTDEPIEEISLRVKAENAKEMAEDNIILNICPEGISILSPELSEDGYLVINTEDADPGEGVKIEPTILKLICVYKDGDGYSFARKGFDVGKFVPTDNTTYHVLKGFDCEITNENEILEQYYICPKNVIPMRERDRYLVKLPVAYPKADPKYKKDIAVELKGEIIKGKIGTREEEWEKLLRACQRYGLTEGGKAQSFMRKFRNKPTAASTLFQIRYALLEEAVEYYTKEAEELNEIGDKMARCETVCNVAKWLGDQALVFLIKRFAGEGADWLELVVMPAKDWIVNTIGQIWADYEWENDVSGWTRLRENFESELVNMVDNGITSLLGSITTDGKAFWGRDFSTSPLERKNFAASIAGLLIGYIGIHTWKRFNDDTGDTAGDLWRSFAYSFRDLTVTAFQILLSKKFSEKFSEVSESGYSGFHYDSNDNIKLQTEYSSVLTKVIQWTLKMIRKLTGARESSNNYLMRNIAQTTNYRKFIGELISETNKEKLKNVTQLTLDAFCSIVADSIVDDFIILCTEGKYIIKIGDAEIRIFSSDWWDIFSMVVCDFLSTIVDWAFLKPAEGVKSLFANDTNIEVIPYTPADEVKQKLNSIKKNTDE